AKGVVEGLLNQPGVEVSFERSNDESLHPVKQATVVIGDNRLGVIGELHPKVAEAFDCKPAGSASEIWVTAPYWRNDISQAVDLIEEVARIIGYDKIPTTMLSQPIPRQNPGPIISLKRRIRDSLVGYGFQEVITYSLTSLEMLNKLIPEAHSIEPVPLRLANPMTADQEYLRPNLRTNLLVVLAANR
ncbi:unnamed protein product, partial [marine sediment metagenome]